MNRKERRFYINNLNSRNSLKKRTTKGAFGKKPSYLKDEEPQDVVVDEGQDHNIADITPKKEGE